MSPPRTADELRATFLDFFAQRGHTPVPSSSLIPHDDTLLFTNAGMVPFKPYFVGDESPPYPRATSIQKCVRAGGKHNDLDDVGRTDRHFTFFEMLGNFSFGDYFKQQAIKWAWELYTEVLGLDPDRLWVTVHTTDDEAEQIWRDDVGLPAERIQRLGDDNFWRMADTGPCGPSSEIFWDRGAAFGPATGPADNEDRYVEIWNLVFMQFDAKPDGELVPLPAPSVDTGAGLERNLAVLQDAASVWDIDVFRPLIGAAEAVTGVEYGTFPGTASDVSLRILAEHGRTMTFLVADGVVPSNEERGYVLRRIIRRAVRHAFLLGAEQLVTPALVGATIDVMGSAYPEIVKQRDLVLSVVSREEERFRQTLARGLELLDGVVTRGDVTGDDAFFLHDTLGFPIDLTREIAGERGRDVDVDGFHALMLEQRTRAKEAHKAAGGKGEGAPLELYRELADELGPTDFTGRQEYETVGAKVRALVGGRDRLAQADAGTAVSVVLDRTPFYAESGGQVGDTGVLETATGARVRVDDTQYGLPGLVLHRGVVEVGTIAESDEAVGADRRRAARRHPAQPHRHPHPALGAARGVGFARAAGRFLRRTRSAALRFQPSRGPVACAARSRGGPRQRRDHRRRARPPLRDHEGARGVARRDRVLRRQVRRPGTGARGRRALDRAVRRYARARTRFHRADQDRERRFDRRQPPPHRGGHRRWRVGAHPRRRAAAAWTRRHVAGLVG